MVEHFTISYAPSAAIALALKRAQGDGLALAAWLQGFRGSEPRELREEQRKSTSGGQGLAQAAASGERSGGNRCLLGGKAQVLTGVRLARNFWRVLPRSPVLHLATHAFADLDDPARSYILLAPATAGREYDYLF